MTKTRQELVREYKDRPKPAGIFQIKNNANDKMFLGSSLNLEGPLNMHRFWLKTGHHPNQALQKDWNEFGADNFVFEILQEVKVTNAPNFNLKDELTLLEQIWLEELKPFERGYNIDKDIRQV